MIAMNRPNAARKLLQYAAVFLSLSAASVGTASAACYMVYSGAKQVIYRSQTPPVDMSRPLHQTIPLVAPGGSMVFALDNVGCELELNRLPDPASLQARSNAPGQRAIRRVRRR